MKTTGAIIGALLGPLLVFLIVAGVYEAPSSNNWDFGTPLLTMGAMIFAMFPGAIGGLFAGGALADGKKRLAFRIAAVAVVIVILPAIWILAIPYLPEAEFKPAQADARAKWASEKDTLYSIHGIGLAANLRDCMRRLSGEPSVRFMRNGCSDQRRTYFGKGPDTVAAQGGYIMGDEGWRWDVVPDSVYHAVVFPDPLVKQAGPVYDVTAYRILRKASRDAPGFHTDPLLPMMVLNLKCMARRAAVLKQSGKWDGDGTTLPPLLVGPDDLPGGCPISIYERPDNPRAIWKLEVGGNGLSSHRVEYRWTPSGKATAYEIYYSSNGVNFMLDDAGEWHMKNGGRPYLKDPAPPPCMFDLRVPCN